MSTRQPHNENYEEVGSNTEPNPNSDSDSDDAAKAEAQREQAIADAAYEASVTAKVTRTNRVDEELNFDYDLDALDAAFEEDDIIVIFNFPDGTKFPIEMRPMTPGEMAVYYQTLFGHSLLAAAGNPLNIDEDVVSEAAVQLERDKESVRLFDDRLLSILESCIKRPHGLTVARIQRWGSYYLNKLYNALVDGGAPTKSVAQFPEVDEGSGE